MILRTTIGLLIAIALPLLDFALYRPARRSLGDPRLLRIERLIYMLFLLSVGLLAISSFGMMLIGRHMHGWMLILHMSVAGLFAVTLTALGLLWAEQSAQVRAQGGEGERFYPGEKAAFWMTLAAGLATILTAMLGMMSWFGSDAQDALLRLHRYSGMVLLICVVFHGYRLLLGQPKAR